MLNARLIGGQLNKARRGELSMPTPLGYVVGPDGKLMLDPDEQIQSIVRLLFDTFQRSGSAGAVVRYFREQALAWPQRVATSCIPSFCQHQITPKTSRYTRCSMSMFPNVSINGRIRSSGQLGRWWYSISPCRNNECVRRFTVFAFNQRS